MQGLFLTHAKSAVALSVLQGISFSAGAWGRRLFLSGGSTVEIKPLAVDVAGEEDHQSDSWHIYSQSVGQNLSRDPVYFQELRKKVRRVDI